MIEFLYIFSGKKSCSYSYVVLSIKLDAISGKSSHEEEVWNQEGSVLQCCYFSLGQMSVKLITQ